MKDTRISDDFNFLELNFGKYHYTDNRAGSPMNYIAYMRKGSVRLVSEKATVCANEGDVFFIPYKLPYQSYWYGDPNVRFLSVGFLHIEAAEKISFDLQAVACDAALKKLISQIPADGVSPKCGTLGIFYSALSGLMPYLKSSRKPSKSEEVVDRAQEYILSHTDCPISEVAKHCFVSEPYLYACFKENACCSPNEYRLMAISRKGKEYLLTTDKRVEEISALLGLSSASHLRRLLKKYIGLTPREIRKSSEFQRSP